MKLKSNSRYEKELRYKAGQFIKFIGKRGLYGKIIFLKDYQIKVEVKLSFEKLGEVHIYYKPTKMSYSANVISNNEYRKDMLSNFWTEMYNKIFEPKKEVKVIVKINVTS